ncbi:PREDICTED: probable inactive poly [ADP-ribose] polymerase SRO2 [Tarenaya hassleriana]|uniref:probable inactive poly [ADP-ribose] polymerase SRO2 n=1 Tax=Tarenaya hassleriana TaxID=28532 RepID=UPI00053C7154|nr:PREDICTED: probable inactive poly [ADP-ribose] polymerase SRO2 [Tarenaya hassleriana]XP_010552643.1 PREDICTED: probable inactive poly [ADP-ribose] polymerase SRO2 [Tarenaya hassleriana]XP_010552644.1 PREDICTED: probable inactive poly [ADP-ribose] polymerase SRO2 [Tarenaya hassleriana]XP_019059148.1 PREDICTED: probable inactive poly [ADP-ribose] polymerase SRO2 [Tarenaya hassleriana]
MAMQTEIEDQASFTSVGSGEILDSISDDADSGFPPVRNLAGDGLIPIGEGNPEFNLITASFLSGLGPVASDTTTLSVLKNSTESVLTKAKFMVFRIFTAAVARKNGGVPNMKYGWFAGSKEEIRRIISLGFSGREIEKFANDAASHGVGIHLVPSKLSLAAALGTEPDEEGLRHLLLCRIILGKSEPLISGSRQMYPSSSEFDSGVDNLQNPQRYIVWSCSMNSHILPSYVVSFRSPRLGGISRDGILPRPSTTWVSFPALISLLSKSLDPPRMNLILETYDDFRKRKLRRDKLVQKMREVAGDDLLVHIIKNYRGTDRVMT